MVLKERKMRKTNNKGAAMVLTVVLIAVMMVFAFSLILISYNLYASQNKNISSARNVEAVNSLSMALEKEMQDPNSNLWKYIRANIAYIPGENDTQDWEDWPYYDDKAESGSLHSKEIATRYFTLERNTDMEGFPGEMTVGIYWTPPGSGPELYHKMTQSPMTINARRNTELHIVVSATTASQTYQVEDVYRLQLKKTSGQEAVEVGQIFNQSRYNPANHNREQYQKDYDYKEKWEWKHIKKK